MKTTATTLGMAAAAMALTCAMGTAQMQAGEDGASLEFPLHGIDGSVDTAEAPPMVQIVPTFEGDLVEGERERRSDGAVSIGALRGTGLPSGTVVVLGAIDGAPLASDGALTAGAQVLAIVPVAPGGALEVDVATLRARAVGLAPLDEDATLTLQVAVVPDDAASGPPLISDPIRPVRGLLVD